MDGASWYCSVWTGSPRTSGVTSGDVMFGEVGAGEPSTTNCPINNIAVDVTAMEAMS